MPPMFRLHLVAFCIFLMVNTTSGGPRGLDDIGKGVRVDAHVLYTSKIHVKAENINDNRLIVQSKNDTIFDYFKDLFELVQMYFHYYKVMINFTVTSVREKNDLVVNFGTDNNTIDGPATLENITKYAENATVKPSNNSIYYLFTWQVHTWS
ncbi:uncharacterized protein LOC125939912 [Dermacentor silvarum]|uniref:uncharacterized protein LOC125939912 n=1 Tax=Dermacentor silvarum TaxID=543639 RepID=UPI00210171CB|nr:uncharacterized protein LOC125939912 [Dermacentor silvarum]